MLWGSQFHMAFPTGFIRGFVHFHKQQLQLRVLATAKPIESYLVHSGKAKKRWSSVLYTACSHSCRIFGSLGPLLVVITALSCLQRIGSYLSFVARPPFLRPHNTPLAHPCRKSYPRFLIPSLAVHICFYFGNRGKSSIV